MSSDTPFIRPGTVILVAAVGGVVALYSIGLALNNWVVVSDEADSSQTLGYMGLFQACGFNTSLQVSGDVDVCVNLFSSAVSGWMMVVQGFSILCLILLAAVLLFWAYVVFYRKLEEKRFTLSIVLLWITTGLLTIVPVAVLAGNMPRQHELVIQDKNTVDKLVQANLHYGGGFIVHCVVSGVINSISFIGLCILLLFYRCYGKRRANF